jgi:hypothetical protein
MKITDQTRKSHVQAQVQGLFPLRYLNIIVSLIHARLDDNSYSVLEAHRKKNKATRPPSVQHLSDCREKQQGGSSSQEDTDNDDTGDSDDSDGEDGRKRRRRTIRAGPATPFQETFYPKPWRLVFKRAKHLIFRYLLLQDFFPDQAKEAFLKRIAEYLLECIAHIEKHYDLALPSGRSFEL